MNPLEMLIDLAHVANSTMHPLGYGYTGLRQLHINIIGIDHVAIGADYDGIPTLPVGLEDVSTYSALFAELGRRGWKELDLQKLAARNLIRVFRQTEKLQTEWMSYLPPFEDMLPESENSAEKSCRTDMNEW
ncbi:hypothetical protein DPMN_136430 [Dreissena polymorpha]|uniref:Dipeptidase n=1 Tax=Dreissena polymorpha TaxID=45954 RepID=A0A9D4G3U3_DREPO|nr:hypothetical protein DPMN_136430 [Dreissena polymorpha]